MNIKTICFGAMALSMIAGSALAGAGMGTSALDGPASMQPFYAGSGMRTPRGNNEFFEARKALTLDTAMITACQDGAKDVNLINTHPEFCSGEKLNGGSK